MAFLRTFVPFPTRLSSQLSARLPARRPRILRFQAQACYVAPALQSLNNPRVKAARSLLRRRTRVLEGKILLEGHRLVLDAVAAGHSIESLFYTNDALARGSLAPTLLETVRTCGGRAALVSDKVMASLSDVVTPQGVVAVLVRPERPLPISATLVLVCDSMKDPGNVGTLVRAAAGAGVHGVLLTSGCADVWGLKALRSGMGAQLRLPIMSDLKWAQVEHLLLERGISVCVADGAASTSYADADWTKPRALVVGSEADGLSPEALRATSLAVSVPMANQVESLNAAVAGAIILFEASRQRMFARSA